MYTQVLTMLGLNIKSLWLAQRRPFGYQVRLFCPIPLRWAGQAAVRETK